MEVTILPSSHFYDWMRMLGKEGGQNKFPRVIKGDKAGNWKEFVQEKGCL
jgi:hypothetical protein